MMRKEMKNICVTCLSRDRSLKSLKSSGLFKLLKSLLAEKAYNKLMTTNKLCWECTAQLKNVRRFQNKAFHSLQRLQEYSSKSEIYSEDLFKPRTMLTVTKMNNLGIDGDVRISDEETLQKKTKVKIEIDNNQEEMIKYEDHEVAESACEVTESAGEITKSTGEGMESANEIKIGVKNELVSRENTQKLRVIKFAHKKVTSLHPKRLKKTSGPPWTVKILTSEELIAYRNTELNKDLYSRKPFKCNSCVVSYWCDLDLDNHDKLLHDESKGPHVCEICRSRYRNEEEKDQCTKSHYSVYQCTKCAFYTWSVNTIRTHNKNVHRYGDFRCRKCRKNFETHAQHSEHYKTAHRKVYKCEKCDLQLYSYNTYTTHSLSHKTESDVICSKCQKSFRSIPHLRTHMRTHVHEQTQVYCHVCNRHMTAAAYKTHVKTTSKHINADMLRFVCEHCEKKFSTLNSLNNHVKVVHLKIYDYKCDICDKLFSSKSYLNTHLTQVHDPNYVKQLKYICHICGNGFLTRTLLKNHSAKHTGEKPYQCPKCPFKTGYSGSLHTHNKLVHEKIKRKSKTKEDT